MAEQKQEIVLDEIYESDYLVDHFKSTLNYTMPNMHKHNCHELYFLLSGDVRYVIGHNIYDVNAGDIVIIPKEEIHRTLHRSEKKCERMLIYFSDDFISSFSNHISPELLRSFFQLGCVRISKMHQEKVLKIFTEMEKEQLHSDNYSKLKTMSLLCDLIILILRYGSSVERTVSDTTESRIVEAMQYIQTNCNRDISLSSVAHIACMEATYFSKCFKKIAGVNFHEFLTQTRLKKAEILLRTSPVAINQIAEDCGFLSSKNFWAVFKKYKGVSPREYKKLSK